MGNRRSHKGDEMAAEQYHCDTCGLKMREDQNTGTVCPGGILPCGGKFKSLNQN